MNNIFYTPSSRITDQRMELTEKEAHHASKVLRYSEGDQLVVVDGEGTFYQGPIVQINRDSLVARVKDSWHEAPATPEMDLGMAIIKKRDRLEFAIEKAVELGVQRFYLFPGRHSEKSRVRKKRLQTIALSAMKQSLRPYKPVIKVVAGLTEAIRRVSDSKIVVAHQEERPLREKLDLLKEQTRLLMCIGPEGGFSSEEVEKIKDQGGDAVSLGSKRLRAETAALKIVCQLSL